MTWRTWPWLLFSMLLGVGGAAQARPSSPQQPIAVLEMRLIANANDVNTILALAGALLDRTSASNNPQTLERARVLISKALTAAPGNPVGHTLNARQLMLAHRFSDALAAAAQAKTLGATDVATLSIEADALTELGRYEEAEAVIQILLDRHYGPAALSRAAHFRFLYGDLDGAIELAKRSLASERLQPFEQAWLTLQVGELLLYAGDFEGARKATLVAEQVAAPAALALRARVSEAQGLRDEAVMLLRAAVQQQLRPEFITGLWRLTLQRGDLAAAAKLAAILDGMALLDEASGSMNRRIFASWFAEQDGLLDVAERLARAELAARPDIYSHDLLAWVLHRQGKNRAALPHAQRAIALGTPDPQLLAHAAAVFKALDNPKPEVLPKATPAVHLAPAK